MSFDVCMYVCMYLLSLRQGRQASKEGEIGAALTQQRTIRLRYPQRVAPVLAKVRDDVRGDGLVYHGRQNVRCVFDGGDFVHVDGEDLLGEFGAGLEGRGEVRLAVPEGVLGFDLEGQVR